MTTQNLTFNKIQKLMKETQDGKYYGVSDTVYEDKNIYILLDYFPKSFNEHHKTPHISVHNQSDKQVIEYCELSESVYKQYTEAQQ